MVTNRRKQVHRGRTVTSFVVGTRRLFDFVDDNPLVHFYGCDLINDTAIIRKNDRAVAINSALQIDLSGQVCADSIGHRIYSGIGGQMDFIRGAALSRGGRAIIALPSTAKGGAVSRIVPELLPGAGVVTTRGHVHWVVTEHGAVNLHGLTLRERGEALIRIAHPDFAPSSGARCRGFGTSPWVERRTGSRGAHVPSPRRARSRVSICPGLRFVRPWRTALQPPPTGGHSGAPSGLKLQSWPPGAAAMVPGTRHTTKARRPTQGDAAWFKAITQNVI